MRVSVGVPLFIAACALSLSGAALAQLPQATVNVVRISVQHVDMPSGSARACVVSGRVTDVFDGPSYKRGQAIRIEVPCSLEGSLVDSRPGAPFSGTMGPNGLDARALAASRDGLASLNGEGRLIWSSTLRRDAPRGDWTVPWMGGYRVLDGAVMPLDQGRAS